MPSSTVEDYVKQLYLEQQQSDTRLVPLGRLAGAMRVTSGTVTTMVKAMAEAGLVEYEPRAGVRLTDNGERLALHVLRRHRLVELLLVQVLGLDWSEVHQEAEELEHVISDKVLEKIDTLLGRPRFDPHGDPIPSATGQIARPQYRRLIDCRQGQQVRVAQIEDQDEVFLRFLADKALTPGQQITIHAIDPVSDSVTLQGENVQQVTLGTQAAGKILVSPI